MRGTKPRRHLGAKGWSGCVLVVTLLVTPAWGQETRTDESAERLYYAANGLLNRGLYELAVAEYRDFLTRHADDANAPMAHYGLGVCLYRLDRAEDAARALAPVADRPGFEYAAEAATVRGQCLMTLGRYDDAAACVTVVLERSPDHALADEAAALTAEARYLAGRHDGVAAPCRWLAQHHPASPVRDRAELFWGLSDVARGDHAEAAGRFDALLRRSPDGPYAEQTSLLLAQCLDRTGALDRAIESYRRVIQRASAALVSDAQYGLAVLLHRRGDGAAAATLLDQLLAGDPDGALGASARLLRGRLWFEDEEYERAAELFTTVAQEDVANADEAAYWQAKCSLRRGDARAAARLLAAAQERFPESAIRAEMMYDRAVALLQTGNDDDALTLLATLGERSPDHALAADALAVRATTRHRRGEYDESDRLCRLFRRTYPRHEMQRTIAFLEGENAFLRGDHQAAATAFVQFLGAFPSDARRRDAEFRLGMALYRLDRDDEAQPLLHAIAGQDEVEPSYRPAVLALGDLEFRRRAWDAAAATLARYVDYGADQPSADDALLKLGLAHHRAGRHEQALRVYERLIDGFDTSAHHAQAVFERGQTLIALDRAGDAEAAFVATVDEADARFTVHAMNHLGRLTLARGAPEEAAAWYGRAAGADADATLVAPALARRGDAFMVAEQYGDAEAAYTELIERFPESPPVAAAGGRRAIAIARQRRSEEALATIAGAERAHGRALEPALGAALAYEKAWCLRELDRDDAAAEVYRTLIADAGDDELARRARLELAELDAAGARYDAAVDHLRELRDDAAATPALRAETLYRLGVCEFRRDEPRAAAAALERLLDEHPDYAEAEAARLLCGEALFAADAHDRAARHLRRLVDADPPATILDPALLRLGESQAVLQLWPRSAEAFTRHLDRLPDSAQAYQARFGLAWAQENQGRLDEAIASYRVVVAGHAGPTAARAQFQIGQCLFAQKRHEEAARELLRVDILYAYPEWSAAALYEAGRCFQALGNLEEARTQFEQVQREHGSLRWARLAGARLEELSPPGLPGH